MGKSLKTQKKGDSELVSTRRSGKSQTTVKSLQQRGGGEMMKRLIVFSVVMLVALATAASAALDTAWVIKLRVSDLNGANAGSINQYGTGATGRNSQTPGPSVVFMYLAGSEPNYYFRDIRAPEPYNVVMEWKLTVAAKSGYPASQFKLIAWNESGATSDLDDNWGGVQGTQPDIKPVNPDPEAFFVRLYMGDTLLYTFNPRENGTSTAPQFSAVYNIQPGQTIENMFRLVREPVPEPGSIIALATGLVGLAGFGIRRRK
jgi:hypothetical protein